MCILQYVFEIPTVDLFPALTQLTTNTFFFLLFFSQNLIVSSDWKVATHTPIETKAIMCCRAGKWCSYFGERNHQIQ